MAFLPIDGETEEPPAKGQSLLRPGITRVRYGRRLNALSFSAAVDSRITCRFAIDCEQENISTKSDDGKRDFRGSVSRASVRRHDYTSTHGRKMERLSKRTALPSLISLACLLCISGRFYHATARLSYRIFKEIGR